MASAAVSFAQPARCPARGHCLNPSSRRAASRTAVTVHAAKKANRTTQPAKTAKPPTKPAVVEQAAVDSTSPPAPAVAAPASPAQSAPPPAPRPAAAHAVSVAERDNVLGSCLVTNFLFVLLGEGARRLSGALAANGVAGAHDLTSDLRIIGTFTGDQVDQHLASIGVALGVTALRQALLASWAPFKEANDFANTQTLTQLSIADIFVISFLSGLGEEWLFRGALLPAVGVNYTGAAVAAAVFGALHVTGGRNAAFAAWAGAVGLAYGGLTVYAGDVSSAILSHTLANTLGGVLWKQQQVAAGMQVSSSEAAGGAGSSGGSGAPAAAEGAAAVAQKKTKGFAPTPGAAAGGGSGTNPEK